MQQDQQSLLKLYWQRRITSPWVYTLVMNTFSFIIALSAVLNSTSDTITRVNLAYLGVAFVVYGLTLPRLFSRRADHLVRFGFMVYAIRVIIYPFFYDALGLMDIYESHEWQLTTHIQLMAAMLFFVFHLQFFNPDEAGHTLFGVLYFCQLFFATYLSVFGLRVSQFTRHSKLVLVFFSLLLPLVIALVKSETTHTEHIRKMFKNICDQEFLKMVLHTNHSGLAILNEANLITFANEHFTAMFDGQIKMALRQDRHDNSVMSSSSLDSGFGRRFLSGRLYCASKTFKRVKKWWARRKKKPFLEEGIDELSQIHQFGRTKQEQINFETNFYDMSLFLPSDKHEASDSFQGPLSIHGVLSKSDSVEAQVFRVITASNSSNDAQQGQNVSDSPSSERYVKIEVRELLYLKQKRLMLQIIDVSDSIRYDQSKEQNQMLSILNATVSHELRNPLNAITGQNVSKEGLYSNILQIQGRLRRGELSASSAADQVEAVMAQLKASLKIQDSSAKMMSFLVQDFLDYAQIKSGKFRTNIKPFNIVEAVERVMLIQKLKAVESGIDLHSEFAPLGGTASPEVKELRVITDEQRVMQVLLNLQSNALKFTQNGSVTIRVTIETRNQESYLRVAVKDTGIGIPYEDQGKLFQLFGFVKSTEQYNRNGIGLGLVISQKIVEKFGGAIGVESVPAPAINHGTTFTFTFKLLSEDEFSRSIQEEASCDSKCCLNSKILNFDWKPPTEVAEQAIQASCYRPRILGEPKRPSSTKKLVAAEDSISNISLFSEIRGETPILNLPIISQPQGTLSYNSPNPEAIEHLIGAKGFKWSHSPLLRTKEDVERSYSIELSNVEIQAEAKRILIVDDQIFNVHALQAILEHKFNIPSHHTDYALNGEEALRMIVDDSMKYQARKSSQASPAEYDPLAVPSSYALILMDCNMPFMDGFECTEKIRRHFVHQFGASLLSQPLISATTGHVEPYYIQKCFSYGMNQVLSKPVEEEPMLAACVRAGLTTEVEVKAFQKKKL